MGKLGTALLRLTTMLIILLAFIVPLLPTPAYADTPSYFVMGQVFIVNGAHITVAEAGRIATNGNTTLNLTDDGVHGTFSIYMANGTTGTVTSGTSTISGSPVTLAAGLNSITATGTGTAILNITIGTAANWNTVNSWAAASGGQCGAAIPTSSNSAYFDANSFTAASQVVTVDAAANCLDMDWTGALNNPTLTCTNDVNIYGNCTFISAMACNGGAYLKIRGTCAFTSGGLSIGTSIQIYLTGTVTLQDNLTTAATPYGYLYIYNGTLDTNNKTISCTRLGDNGVSLAKTLTLGTSTISITGVGGLAFTGAAALTLTDSTHTINISGTAPFNVTSATTGSWGTVNLNGTSHTISGSNEFVNLTRTGTATKTDTLTLTSGTTQTVTGTLTLSGNSSTNRLLVQSSTLGTDATIYCDGTVEVNNADFMDFEGTGTPIGTGANDGTAWNISACTGLSGDCGGNTGITFTTSAAQTSGSTATWSTAAKWTSRVPLPQDDVTCSHSTTVDMPRIGRSITFTGTPVISLSNDINSYGSWTMASGMTWTDNYKDFCLRGRASYTLTTSGKLLRSIIVEMPGGTITLQDNVDASTSATASTSKHGAGTIDATGRSVSLVSYYHDITLTRTLNLTNATLTLTRAMVGGGWAIAATGFTFISTNSTIVVTNSTANAQTFAGGGLTYNNVTVQGAGAYALTISGNNTFNTFTVDRSVASKTLTLTASSNQTIADFSCPTSSTRVLTVNSTGAAAILTKTGGGGEMVDYVNLSNNTGSPANTWYYGLNSTIGAGVTGWSAGIVPSVTTTAATSVEETTATANANITDLHYSEPVTVAGIDYDIDSGSPYAFNAHTHGSFAVGAYSQALTGLTAGELYYYSANVTDMAGIGNGGELTFLTKPLAPTITSIESAGVNQLLVTWAKGVGANRTMVRYKDGSYPTSITDGSLGYYDTGVSTIIGGLLENHTYYVSAWSERTEGGHQQYSDSDSESQKRSSGMADNMMDTIVALAMALATIICMFVLIGQLGQGQPIEEVIKIVIIAVLGMICFVVMKGVVGL